MPTIDLYLLPKDAPPERLADATVIVIDLLRASTTICHALAAGAECVMPFAEIDETLAAADRFGRRNVLLGGERHGKLIAGFDLGNSPAEYTPQAVAGRRILFSTTNGARALQHARGANHVLVGAAVNRAAAARAVRPAANVAILCAGTDGQVAHEDELAGGAIIEALFRDGATWSLSETASAALDAWQKLVDRAHSENRPVVDDFADRLRTTQGGRNLLDIGHDADLPACAQLDALTVVPELNPATGELRCGIAAASIPS
jgi:2-phosphosulfolactate phosphatase